MTERRPTYVIGTDDNAVHRNSGVLRRLRDALWPVVERLPPLEDEAAFPHVTLIQLERRLGYRELARLVLWPVVEVQVQLQESTEAEHLRSAVAVNVQRPPLGE